MCLKAAQRSLTAPGWTPAGIIQREGLGGRWCGSHILKSTKGPVIGGMTSTGPPIRMEPEMHSHKPNQPLHSVDALGHDRHAQRRLDAYRRHIVHIFKRLGTLHVVVDPPHAAKWAPRRRVDHAG